MQEKREKKTTQGESQEQTTADNLKHHTQNKRNEKEKNALAVKRGLSSSFCPDFIDTAFADTIIDRKISILLL